MFNLAIDSKLRGCDVVAIKVDDITLTEVALIRSPRRQGRAPWPGWSLGQPGLPQSFSVSRKIFGTPKRSHHVLEIGNTQRGIELPQPSQCLVRLLRSSGHC